MVRGRCVSLGLMVVCLLTAGCRSAKKPDEQKPVWDQAKIGELAPQTPEVSTKDQPAAMYNLDLYAVETPVDRINTLKPLWASMPSGPLRSAGAKVLAANGFKVRLGRSEMWPKINGWLQEAGGQQAMARAIVLADGQFIDLPILPLPGEQVIHFVDAQGRKNKVAAGAGYIVLRIKTERIPGSRGVVRMTVCPVYTVPTAVAIPELRAQAKGREMAFLLAAFSVDMAPGDLVTLGPEEYTGDMTALAGIVFNPPGGTMFFDPARPKPPERKASFRVFIIACSAVRD